MITYNKALLSLVLWLGMSCLARADTYYLVLFAYDSKPIPVPYLSHVWGEFVRVDDAGKVVKEVSLSWNPDKFSCVDKARPGINLSNKETLDFAIGHKKSIRMWGPYAIDKDLFSRAERQYDAHGQYKFLDCVSRPNAENCIHRLSDLGGDFKTGVYWGWWAADAVDKHFKKRGLTRETPDKQKVIDLLGVGGYDVKRMK